MKKPSAFVLTTYTLTDPTTRNTIYSISPLFSKIVVIQQNSRARYDPLHLDNVLIEDVEDFDSFPRLFGVKSILKWVYYKIHVRRLLRKFKPDVIVTFMLSPLAAIKRTKNQLLVSCIYDIPYQPNAGRLDRKINIKGYQQLATADKVWASDAYKARLAAEFGELTSLPAVCYNSPRLQYIEMEDRSVMRSWLREKLRGAGAKISDQGGSILIRAGAVGVFGGIEETLKAMHSLPDDHIFLLMGRPEKSYGDKLRKLISSEQLDHRVFLWDRPDDETWKKAIFGADIGHLIHLPPPEDSSHAGMYAFNSSLSNYRMFYYMAAGLPTFSYDDKRLDDVHLDVNCFRVLRTAHLIQDTIDQWKLLGSNDALKNELSQNARNAFVQKYNWENQFEEIRSYINAFVDKQ